MKHKKKKKERSAFFSGQIENKTGTKGPEGLGTIGAEGGRRFFFKHESKTKKKYSRISAKIC